MFLGFVKQSTAIILQVGPFRNYLSGVARNDFAPGSADDAVLVPPGGSAAIDISGNTFSAKTNADGLADLTLTAGNLATIGIHGIYYRDDDVIMPYRASIQVVEESVYTALFASSGDVLSPDVANRMNRSAGSMPLVTVDSGSSVSSVIASAIDPASSVNDQFNGRVLIFASDTTTAALRGQAKQITDFDHSGQTFTTDAFTTAPQSGDTAVVV